LNVAQAKTQSLAKMQKQMSIAPTLMSCQSTSLLPGNIFLYRPRHVARDSKAIRCSARTRAFILLIIISEIMFADMSANIDEANATTTGQLVDVMIALIAIGIQSPQ
jgi:hypothetical protein